ncbi:cytochrome b [Poseidonocella sedimentorum]|uniref:Cytochrome b561 n=1 Tax=Poseidonocella sedimentorum TaxID=871652 RepID=A0A1I6CYM3_9RHOB|nr:cytochrome b/b6 domain-containing protein [Poseidonocella sedimentorum]SFQ98197.1 cytochrome b561 [Poseidonocella sedimentorum]
MSTSPAAYRPAQIILHWVVFAALWVQWLFNEPMKRTLRALQTHATPAGNDTTMAWVHAGFGSAIFLAVLARLYLRYRYGAPGHAPGTSPMQARIATTVHWALYGALIGMVITGGMTWNGVADLGDVHGFLNIVLFGLITIHAAAAVFNQFVRKDGTLLRMMVSRKT